MSMVYDIAEFLENNGLGNVGVDIFCGDMPESPNNVIAVYQYAGKEYDNIAGLDYPGLQIRTRATDYEDAADKIALAESVLRSVGDELNDNLNEGVVINGSFYLRIAPVQSAFPLGRDESGRMEFAQNYYITLRRN
ncbi:MAG: hypothetical protein KAQ68_00725 [Clostridiales bacterium]|nr:hypothetical protein [Clostridiales bacterium]